MPNGGISLLPEEMREKEKQELEKKVPEKKGRPELYVPEAVAPAAEPEAIKPEAAEPVKEEEIEKEEVIPYKPKPRPKEEEPLPAAKPPIPPRRGLRVSLIPEERIEKRINVTMRKIIVVVIVVVEVLAIAAAWFIISSQTDSKNQKLAQLEQSISQLNADISAVRDQQQELLLFEKKLASISDLLDQHVYTSKIFEFLEKNTLPNVWYSSYISTSDGQVALNANARDLETAARQIAHFETLDQIQKLSANSFQAKISDAGYTEGVTFDLQIIFALDFLLKSE